MALNLGTINCYLALDTSKFGSGVEVALKSVEKIGRNLSKIGKGAQQVVDGVGAIFNQAAKFDPKVAGVLKEVTNAQNTLAVTAGQALLPALQSVANVLTGVVQAYRQLSPEMQKTIAHFATMGVGILGVVAVAGKLAGLVGALAGIAGALLPILPVVLGIGLALGAVFVAVSFLRTAWDENWGGMQQTVDDVMEAITGAWSQVVGFFKSNGSAIGSVFLKIGNAILSNVLEPLRLVLVAAAKVGSAFGSSWGDAAQAAADTVGDMQKRGLEGMVADGVASGGKFVRAVVKGARSNFKSVKGLADDMQKAMGLDFSGSAKLPQMSSIADQEKARVANLDRLKKESQTAADAARKAADACTQLGDQWKKMGKSLGGMIGQGFMKALGVSATATAESMNAAASLGAKAAGKLGKLGDAAQSAIEGFTVAGPWGAIIAIIGELLMGSKQFGVMLKQFDEGVGMLSDMIGEILEPFIELGRSGNQVLQVIVNVLTPILRALADIIGSFLAPAIQTVERFAGNLGAALMPLGVILGVLAIVIGAISDVVQDITGVFDPLGLILRGLFEVIKWLGVAVTGIAIGIFKVVRWLAEAWNNMMYAVANIIRDIAMSLGGEDNIVGKALLAISFALNGATIGLGGVNGTIAELVAAQDSLVEMTWDSAHAAAGKAAADTEAAKAARDVSEALTNVPEGFKVASARFSAMDGQAGTSSGGSGNTGFGTQHGPGLEGTPQQGGDTYVFNIGGSLLTPGDISGALDLAKKKKSRKSRGSRLGDF